MRIVLIYQHFLVSGIGSTKPHGLARDLVAAGHDVTVICGRGLLSQGVDVPPGLLRRLDIDGVRVLSVGVRYAQRMGFARRIAAFLAFTLVAIWLVCRLPRYHVLLASSTPLTVGLAALVARYARRVPYVFEVRDLWPEVPFAAGYLRSRLLFSIAKWFEEWFYREAAVVTAVGRRMCARLVERGVPVRKVFFFPSGARLSEFDGPPDAAFRAEHGLDGCWVAVYMGTIGRVNGLDYLVEAATHLKGRGDVRLVLVGDGSEREHLEAEASRRGVAQVIRFVPPIRRERVPGVLKAADATLLINASGPGMQYVMTSKFYDYLAAGRPILVNAECEAAEWIRAAGAGLFAEPDDPALLAAAIDRLRADPDEAAAIGRRARNLAAKEFNQADLNARWEQLLVRVAAERAGAARSRGARP